MKSRTSAALRIRAICEYTILRTFMIMFSFLAAMFLSLRSFSRHGRVLRMEPFTKLLKRASLILECISSHKSLDGT